MSIISRLAVVLGLDTAEFNAGLGKAEQGINKFSAMSGAMKAGVIALGGAFVATAKNALDFADEMTDLAKANEMSVASVLELTQALTTSGGKVENAGKLIASFTNKVDEAAQGSQKTRDKFKELGISLSDLGKLSQEALLQKTIDGLSQIDDSVRRNALAFDLLGKAAKGVDFKTLADDMRAAKGEFDKSEESFRKIERFSDNIAAAWFRAKVNIADALVGIAEVADKEMQKVFFNQKKYANKTEAILAGDLFYNPAKDGKFKPITDTKVYKPDFTATNVPNANRPILASDEATKLADKLQKQKDQMEQQAMSLERQKEALYGQKSVLEEINAEFTKSGKYYQTRNSAEAKALQDAARRFDLAKEEVEKQKEAVQQAIRKNEIEMQERQERAQDAANEAIQKANHDLEFSRRLESLDLAKQKSQLEAQSAGLSDTQREKLSKLFDMEAEIVRLKKEDYRISDAQLEAYRESTIALIEQEEATKRAQNTFQAGWDRAYANFIERANDTAALGTQAFDGMASSMTNALDQFVSNGKVSFKDLINSMITDLLRLYMKAQATNIFGSLNLSSFFGGGSGGVSATAGAYDIFNNPYLNMGGGFADGGSPPVGIPSLVGERGPELFVPKTAGTIIPNNQLSNMMGQQPQVVYNGTVIQNMNAIDTQSGVQFIAKNKDAIWAANQSANRSLPMSR